MARQASAPRLFFREMDVKTKALGQVLVTRRGNDALVLHTRKIDFSIRVADEVFVFLEMGVETKPLAQDWDSRWKSEVPAIG